MDEDRAFLGRLVEAWHKAAAQGQKVFLVPIADPLRIVHPGLPPEGLPWDRSQIERLELAGFIEWVPRPNGETVRLRPAAFHEFGAENGWPAEKTP